MDSKSVTRRKFLAIAGGAAGAGLLCISGVAAVRLRVPPVDFYNLEVGMPDSNSKRVLVAYASKYGSTGEVAKAVGEALQAAGAAVDVHRTQAIKTIGDYDAVVVGSAARMGKLLSEAVRFSERNRAALQKVPTAYFVVGTTMKTDTPARRDEAAKYLKPLDDVQPTRAPLGLFAGKVDYSKLEPLLRMVMSIAKGDMGDMSEGDFRNWEAIRAWAQGLAPYLLS